MKNLEKLYNDNKALVYNELEKEYLVKKEKARDLRHVIKKSFEDLDKRSAEYSSKVKGFNFTVKRYEVEDYLNEDKNATLNEALIKATNGFKASEIENIVKVLSTSRAFGEFNQLLRDEEDKLSAPDFKDEKELIDKIDINWTNGNNKTDFVKLIYGFHKAKLINNGKGDITKIVETLGNQFNVGLGKGWQSNLSKNKNARNNDYDSLEIFDRIKNAYESYLKEKNK